jgi:hypothetical protein
MGLPEGWENKRRNRRRRIIQQYLVYRYPLVLVFVVVDTVARRFWEFLTGAFLHWAWNFIYKTGCSYVAALLHLRALLFFSLRRGNTALYSPTTITGQVNYAEDLKCFRYYSINPSYPSSQIPSPGQNTDK